MKELPQLTGSEKQVRWAESIRSKKVAEWSRVVGDNYVHQECLSLALRKADAAWWIAYRDADLKTVLNQMHYGYDKVKEDRKRYKAGQEGGSKRSAPKPVAPASKVTSGGPQVVAEGVTVAATEGKMMTVGPTRNRFTGEIVNDKDCPF